MKDLELPGQLLETACDALRDEMSDFVLVRCEPMLLTANWLVGDFIKKLDKVRRSPPTQKSLADQTRVLSDFTNRWTIYQVAWEQRHARDPDTEAGLTLKSLRAADKVVRGLYKVVQQEELNLIMPHQLLIVVPFMDHPRATGFRAPTPYIISPYWGHRQVWVWLAYAHEVGHHVYRNVETLRIALMGHVSIRLLLEGKASSVVSDIWLNWLEEIFADIFGLLQIGPAFARTQQLMLPYLPRPKPRGEVRNPWLIAADETHPIPYLRVFLAFRALEKLGIGEADTKPLKENWEKFFHEDQGVDDEEDKMSALVEGSPVERTVKEMKQVAEIVLDTILNTDLYQLAKTSSPDEPRKLRDVFSESLDETRKRIKAARQAIISGVPSGEFEIRHLLAAAQELLEMLTGQRERLEKESVGPDPWGEAIEGLSERVISITLEAY